MVRKKSGEIFFPFREKLVNVGQGNLKFLQRSGTSQGIL